MYLNIENGDHGVVLSSFDDSKQQDVSEAIVKLFKFDAELAGSILKNVPIVIFEDMEEEVGKLVLERMQGLSSAGCKLELVEAPFDTTQKMKWPKPHRFIRAAQRKLAKQSSSTLPSNITCSGCGEELSLGIAVGEHDAAAGEPVALDPGKALELMPSPETAAEAIEKLVELPSEDAASEPVEDLIELPLEEPVEDLIELPSEDVASEPVENLVELPSEEIAVEEIEEIIELPEDEDAAFAGDAPVEIMELDEFETSIGEVEIEELPEEADGEEIGVLTDESAQAIEEIVEPEKTAEKSAASEAKTTDADAVPIKEEPAGDGSSVFRVILSKIRSDKTRSEAAEIIASVQGISREKALETASKLIITAAKDVTEARAQEIAGMFTEKNIKALVTKRK